MRKLVPLIIAIAFLKSTAQTNNEEFLRKALYPEIILNDVMFDNDLKIGLEIIDSKIDSIVKAGPSNFVPAKFTIIESRNIGVFEPMEKIDFVKRTAFLSNYVRGYSGFDNETFNQKWINSDNDPDRYIESILSEQNTLGNFFPDYSIMVDHDKVLMLQQTIKTSILRKYVDLKHMVYAPRHSDEVLQLKFSSITDSDERKRFLKYLDENVDNIDTQTFFITPQAIRVSYYYKIDSILYFGVDIYGTHYLMSIDKPGRKIISLREKWVY